MGELTKKKWRTHFGAVARSSHLDIFTGCRPAKRFGMAEDEPGGDPAPGPQADSASSEIRERLAPFVSEKILQSPISEEEGDALRTPRYEASGGTDKVEISPTDVTENVVNPKMASGKPKSDAVEDNLDSLLFLKHDEGWVWESPGPAPAPPPPTLAPRGTIKPIIPYPTSVVFGGSGASAADIQDFHTRMCNPRASPPGSPAVHPDAQARAKRLKVMALKLHDEVRALLEVKTGKRGLTRSRFARSSARTARTKKCLRSFMTTRSRRQATMWRLNSRRVRPLSSGACVIFELAYCSFVTRLDKTLRSMVQKMADATPIAGPSW